MEDLSRNTTQQKNKTKLVLLIVWIVICTAILIYCLTLNVININFSAEIIDEWNNPKNLETYDQQFINDAIKGINESIMLISFSLVFEIILYSSFMFLLIPKLVGVIRSLRIEHRKDIPPQ